MPKRKAPSRTPDSRHKSRLSPSLGLFLLLLITVTLYLRTLGFAFVYDDTSQIAQNPTIRSWSYVPQYFTQHVWGYSAIWTNLYRPVFLIYLRTCNALFDLNPIGWHAFAVVIHLVNVGLVYLVGRDLLKKNDSHKWIPLIAAAIFAVHPIQLETVAWISGITDSLMAAPLLLGFWSYLHWRKKSDARWLAVSGLFFALALLTKESGATMLLLVFAYELTIGRQHATGEKTARVPLGFALLCGITLAYFVARWAVLHTPIGHTATPLSAAAALLTIPSVVLGYIRMLLLPYGMSAFFNSEYVSSPGLVKFVLPLVAVGLILFALDLWSRRTKVPEVAFAGIWVFVGMLPVLNLRMMQADDFIHIRFLYVPSVGLALLITIAIRDFLHEPKLQIAVGLAVVSALAGATMSQVEYWRDDVSLYQRGVAIGPKNPVPKTNLASEYLRAGRDNEAIALLDDVLRTHPNFWTANYNRGSLAYRQQDWPGTVTYMDRAIANHGLEVDAYVYRGFAQMKLGQLNQAEQSIRQAIALRPQAHAYHFVLGLVLRQEQRWNDALTAFEEELKINPNDRNSAIHVADLRQRLMPSPAHH